MSTSRNTDEIDYNLNSNTNGPKDLVEKPNVVQDYKNYNNPNMMEINLEIPPGNGNAISEKKTILKKGNGDNFHGADDVPKQQIKSDWVKFDDDGSVEKHLEKQNTNQNNNNSLTELSDITITVAANQQLNSASAKLSPPPQRTKKSHASTLTSNIDTALPVSNDNLTTTTTTMQTKPSNSSEIKPAVLTTESVHVNLSNKTPQKSNANGQSSPISVAASSGTASVSLPIDTGAAMRTIELSTGRIREGFANGDVIVTLLPINTKWPWVTPAVFRPELVPEELMAQGLTLTVEEYVNAMETLVNDYRFTMYNICYKRILVCWILFAFAVLLTLLFSGLQGIALFSLGVGWLFLNAAAIFLCMWVKLRLSRGLEKCLAKVNKQLIRHKILLVLDDRGRISCHKVNLCFIYFDPAPCVQYLNEFIERSEQNGTNIQAGWESKIDIEINDIVIQGANTVRLSRKQERAPHLYLRYGSRWGNEVIRGLGDVTLTEPARHCAKYICPCQYIERHLSCKPRGKFKMFNITYWVLASERYE